MPNRNSSLVVLAGALLVTGLSMAQTAPKPASLSGVVTNSVTGEPVERARVTLTPINSSTARPTTAITDVKGTFMVTNLVPGQYITVVSRTGFIDGSRRKGITPILLQAGDAKEGVKCTLTPGGVITGRVSDAEGNPVEFASVMIASQGQGSSVITNERGEFRIGGLWPGRYPVMASPMHIPLPEEIRTDGTREDHFSTTFYGGTLGPKGAARVAVQAGTETGGIDIRLIRTPIVSISGKVVGLPAGAKNVYVQVRSFASSMMNSPGGPVKPDGSFRLSKIDPGRYSIFATVFNDGVQLQTASVTVDVATQNIDKLELQVIPPMDIPVTLEYFDEQAKVPPQGPPGQPGAPARPAPPMRMSLRPIGPGFGNIPTAVASPDGSLTLKGIQPGRYRVSSSYSGVYVRSMRLGSQVMDGDILDLSRGSAGAPLAVMLSSGMASISGALKDAGNPVADAIVVLVYDSEDGKIARSTRTGKDGAYTLAAIAPGKYSLLAPDPDDSAALQGEGLDEYEAVTEKVDLVEKDKITRDLKRAKSN